MRNSFPNVELPKPITEEWDWQLHGRCRTESTTLFFPSKALRGAKRQQAELAAKDICRACPVLSQCRDFALRTHQSYGIWGGLTAAERSLQSNVDQSVVEKQFQQKVPRHTIGPPKRPFKLAARSDNTKRL
ncbi:WhiB family transcriptional regulator [Rhodococcoides fascians A21d2]|nr:WhiB family transcriptional regulator [Rhodococcus fascians A21d2]